jgi:hypothetical protein
MNPTILPDRVLRLMSPADRQQLGKAGMTIEECQARYALKTERAEQKLFASWLTQRVFYFIQARADRRSTIRAGHPDFTILHSGRTLLLELKMSARTTLERTDPVSERTAQCWFCG